jgi:hypothetical protein
MRRRKPPRIGCGGFPVVLRCACGDDWVAGVGVIGDCSLGSMARMVAGSITTAQRGSPSNSTTMMTP